MTFQEVLDSKLKFRRTNWHPDGFYWQSNGLEIEYGYPDNLEGKVGLDEISDYAYEDYNKDPDWEIHPLDRHKYEFNKELEKIINE